MSIVYGDFHAYPNMGCLSIGRVLLDSSMFSEYFTTFDNIGVGIEGVPATQTGQAHFILHIAFYNNAIRMRIALEADARLDNTPDRTHHLRVIQRAVKWFIGKQRRLALAMSMHPRLGAASAIGALFHVGLRM